MGLPGIGVLVRPEDGHGRTALVVVPHADDAALQCGGTLALMSRRGWRLVLVRVTNDAFDSAGLDRERTIARNTEELHRAGRVMGVDEILELGFETDRLADVSEVELRERIIYFYRLVKPYAVFSFDPFPGPGENNQDHLRVASACDEAFWAAMFDRHHPEHFEEGLSIHGVYERWYFARRLTEISHAIDISQVIETKVEALAAHETMVRNMLAQIRLQARTGSVAVPVPPPTEGADVRWLAARLVKVRARDVGARYAVPFAEEFRMVRFSDLAYALESDEPYGLPTK